MREKIKESYPLHPEIIKQGEICPQLTDVTGNVENPLGFDAIEVLQSPGVDAAAGRVSDGHQGLGQKYIFKIFGVM